MTPFLAILLTLLFMLLAGVLLYQFDTGHWPWEEQEEDDEAIPEPISQEVAIILAELDAELDGEGSGQKERIARMLKVIFAPHCQRIEIVGSIRRGVADPGDIDILVVPKHKNRLIGAIERVCDDEGAIEREDSRRTRFSVKGVSVHLIEVATNEWGVSMINFTGSRDFNKRWVARAKRRGLEVKQEHAFRGLFRVVEHTGSYGGRWTSEHFVDRTEEDILKMLDLEDYLDPTTRN